MRGLALACTWILQCIVECHFSLEFLSYLWFGATAVSTQTLLRHLSDEHKSQGSHIPHVNSEHVTKHSFPKSLFSSNNVYDDVPLCSLKLFSPLKFFGNFQRSLCKAKHQPGYTVWSGRDFIRKIEIQLNFWSLSTSKVCSGTFVQLGPACKAEDRRIVAPSNSDF